MERQDLNDMLSFIAVAEEHSFTRAAQRLHLVQSTLSVSVRALERELGGRLFERTTHRVQLTDAGQALLTEARATLAAADAARDAVADVQGGVRGTVHVGIMNAPTLIDLAAVLTRYRAERPLVRLVPHTVTGGSAELVAGVLEGTVDLAVAALPGHRPSGLTVRRLASEPLLLACAPNRRTPRATPIPLIELEGEAFVDFPVGWGTRAAVDRVFGQAGLHREIAAEVTDLPTAVELVRAGFGCAFLSRSMAGGARPLTLLAVEPAPMFEVSLITPAGRHPSAAAHAFADLLLASTPGEEG